MSAEQLLAVIVVIQAWQLYVLSRLDGRVQSLEEWARGPKPKPAPEVSHVPARSS